MSLPSPNASLRPVRAPQIAGQILGLVAANHVWTRLLITPRAGEAGPPEIGAGGVLTTLGLAALEELVFRGPLFVWLRTRWSIAAAILTSATLFAALHAPPRAALVALLLGLQLGALRQTMGLGVAVAAHVASNLTLLAIVALPAARPDPDPLVFVAARPDPDLLVFVAASAVAGSALAVLAQRLRKGPR